MPGQVRIIGGKWRRRQLTVLTHPGLRPTSDRVRETLFNWLSPYIVGSRCLDLFTGTGALGVEALSRGASWLTAIDNYLPTLTLIEKTLLQWNATDYELINQDGLTWLSQATQRYDIIFLDPPFESDLLEVCIAQLNQLIKPTTLLYVEIPSTQELSLPYWQIKRQLTTKEVSANLYGVA